jgi:hypothetical protein
MHVQLAAYCKDSEVHQKHGHGVKSISGPGDAGLVDTSQMYDKSTKGDNVTF